MPNEKNDKFEEIENQDPNTPGVEDEDLGLDEEEPMAVPDTVGSRHAGDVESGKGGQEKKIDDDPRIDQDADPSE